MEPQVCTNPSCKSMGEAHPNCHCGSGMAFGGQVGTGCEGKHDKACQYYNKAADVHEYVRKIKGMAGGGVVGSESDEDVGEEEVSSLPPQFPNITP